MSVCENERTLDNDPSKNFLSNGVRTNWEFVSQLI